MFNLNTRTRPITISLLLSATALLLPTLAVAQAIEAIGAPLSDLPTAEDTATEAAERYLPDGVTLATASLHSAPQAALRVSSDTSTAARYSESRDTVRLAVTERVSVRLIDPGLVLAIGGTLSGDGIGGASSGGGATARGEFTHIAADSKQDIGFEYGAFGGGGASSIGLPTQTDTLDLGGSFRFSARICGGTQTHEFRFEWRGSGGGAPGLHGAPDGWFAESAAVFLWNSPRRRHYIAFGPAVSFDGRGISSGAPRTTVSGALRFQFTPIQGGPQAFANLRFGAFAANGTGYELELTFNFAFTVLETVYVPLPPPAGP